MVTIAIGLDGLKRMALFRFIRLASPVHAREGSWSGPNAEKQADSFLQGLRTLEPAKQWTWPIDAEAHLEDSTRLSCRVQLDAGRGPSPRIRLLLVLHHGVLALCLTTPKEIVLESVRIVELLEGRKFPTQREPRYWAWFEAANPRSP